jgi:hypothetical protein
VDLYWLEKYPIQIYSKMGRRRNKKTVSLDDGILNYLHHHVQVINNSKIFAGLMIITLNVVSKFANIKLSKTMEAYFKYTFSRQILVFAIAWMGTRDIYVALFITCCFIVATEYLFHEESDYFILSEEFRDYHIGLLDNETEVTEEDVRKAKAILEKAKQQKIGEHHNEYQSFPMK